MLRRRVALTLALLATLAVTWAMAVHAWDGFAFDLGPFSIRSRDPARAWAAAAVFYLLGIWLGRGGEWARGWIRLGHLAARAAPVVVMVAAVVIPAVAWHYGSKAASGADAFGYVSQASLWLQGDLRIEQPLARRVPWPHADETLAPLGYVPGVVRGTIVPMYAPGLPLMMAVAKVVAGPAGPFWLQPLAGGLLIIATWGLLTRLTRDRALGALAALFMATSPALLFNIMGPMSDTVTAALWMASFMALTWPGVRAAAVAGALGGVAVLVRPNLVPLALAGLAAAWLGTRLDMRSALAPSRDANAGAPDMPATPRRASLVRAAIYGVFIAAGALFIAITNATLYGSPLTSGYGQNAAIYSVDWVAGNLQRYSTWLVASQGWLVVLGLAAPVLWAVGRPRPDGMRRVLPLALVFVIVVASYLLYAQFDAWWFLRFLMPALPLVFGAVAYVMLTLARWLPAAVGVQVLAALVASATVQAVAFAHEQGVLDLGAGEERYISMGRYIDEHLPPEAVVVAMQHSGSVRHYSGRTTVRWDWLERDRLQSALEWLRDEGRQPFLLLDESEVEWFQQRFAGVPRLGSLDLPVVTEITAPVRVRLFDPLGK